jgi:arginine/lysine/ornithine decarboxylase
LALAVADEMQKVYREELGPEPVPLMVPGEVIDEENVSFLFHLLVSSYLFTLSFSLS